VGVSGAGAEFGLGKIALALAILAGAGLGFSYFNPAVKYGLWGACAAYVLIAGIGAIAIVDPGFVAGDEVNTLLAESGLPGATAEWGVFLVLGAALAGAAITGWMVLRTLNGVGLGQSGLEGILDRAQSAAYSVSSVPTSLGELASRTISQPHDAASMATSVADTLTRALGGSPTGVTSEVGMAAGGSQIVVGQPQKRSILKPLLMAVVAVGVIGGAAFGVYYASQNVNLDKDSLPIVGTGKTPEAAPILATLSRPCRDSGGQPCNVVLDITAVTARSDGVLIHYEMRADGAAGCAVAFESDSAIASRLDSEGRPGPFLEGGRGRYYPLLRSEGATKSGGSLNCGGRQKGEWLFAAATSEQSVKLRYPELPPAQIELSPVAVRLLPAADPLSVIPVQSTNCTTADNQPCRGSWEIGPYGLLSDGAAIVFYALRFEGPANCQVNWISDLQAHQDLIGRGEAGIRIERPGGGGRSALIGGGGLSNRAGLLPCGGVLRGSWRFAAGDLGQTVDLIYPDFNLVKLPIRP
jgi:hypothetical protein